MVRQGVGVLASKISGLSAWDEWATMLSSEHAIISAFFGIVIRMYYREHEPAHFHAEYQGEQGKFDFAGEMTVGDIRSATALRLIREWAAQHQGELQANWEHMKGGRPLNGIAPLE